MCTHNEIRFTAVSRIKTARFWLAKLMKSSSFALKQISYFLYILMLYDVYGILHQFLIALLFCLNKRKILVKKMIHQFSDISADMCKKSMMYDINNFGALFIKYKNLMSIENVQKISDSSFNSIKVIALK